MQSETLKIKHTVLPEENLSLEQWKEEYFTGARLKPEVGPFINCPLETYLKHINNEIISQNN